MQRIVPVAWMIVAAFYVGLTILALYNERMALRHWASRWWMPKPSYQQSHPDWSPK